jgi:pimeloyl-ACP methyl ester carboxylesterase
VEEDATYLGIENTMPTTITVAEKQTVNIGALAIKGPIETRTGIEVRNALTKVTANIGRVIALDDPMFSHENAAMGFWRPFDYADQYGGGLMMLQEYEEKKTPVVFVHGITGTGLEFEPVIASLDRERFQAWVLQYPSGVSLDLVSDYFLESLDQLHIRYQFPRVIVVAHSMGGLMARSFVMKHQQSGASYSLSMVMTINSPLYGMDSAAKGVKLSPIVIPAWRDVASGSDFVNKVHAWHWPREIPYHLVFSFLPHKEGDGVVPMRSQLSLSLQDEAVKIHGFQAQHAEVLRDDEFIKRFHSILSGYY